MISTETWKLIECWTRLGHFLHLLPFKCDLVERRLEPLTYSGHAKAFVSYHCMLGLRISFQIWCIVICTRNMIRLNIGWSLDTVFMITFTALHFLQLLCDLKFAFYGRGLALHQNRLESFNWAEMRIHRVPPDTKDGLEIYIHLMSGSFCVLPIAAGSFFYFFVQDIPLYQHFNTGTAIGPVIVATMEWAWLGCGLTNLAVTLGVVLAHCNSLRLWMRRTVWSEGKLSLKHRLRSYRAHRQMQLLQDDQLQLVRLMIPALFLLSSTLIVFGLFSLIKRKVNALIFKVAMGFVALLVSVLIHIGTWFCKMLTRESAAFHAACRRWIRLRKWERRTVKSCPRL